MDKYFDLNKYSLTNEKETLYNLSKDECALHSIKNNYKGFTYENDKNDCFLYQSKALNKKLNNNYINVNSFIKTKGSIDLPYNQQNNYKNYFSIINNKDFSFENELDKKYVNDENECLNECLNNTNDKCVSIIYAEKPKKCIFYDKKELKKHNINNNNLDIYTLKKNINYIDTNYRNMDVMLNWNKIVDNPTLYKCNGVNSTNPFCTKPFNPNEIESNQVQNDYYTDCITNKNFDNIEQQIRFFNKECNKKYGNEYQFDNNPLNLDSVIDCENGKKAKCSMNIYNSYNIMESFNNKTNDNKCILYNNSNKRNIYEEDMLNIHFHNNHNKFFVLLLIFIVFIFIIYYRK